MLDNLIFNSENKKYCEVCGVTLFSIRKEYKFREVKYVSEALSSRPVILLIPKPVPLLEAT